jgi:hypothetical protein
LGLHALHVFRMSLAYACFPKFKLANVTAYTRILLFTYCPVTINDTNVHSDASSKLQPFSPSKLQPAMSLSLNCLIHGEVPEKMFIVEVEKTKTVSILKDLIKRRRLLTLITSLHQILTSGWSTSIWMNSEQNRRMLISMPIKIYHHLARNCHPFLTKTLMMDVFISLQRLLVRRTSLHL